MSVNVELAYMPSTSQGFVDSSSNVGNAPKVYEYSKSFL